MNIHELGGCTPVPLSHYLKALGIIRILAEQTDCNVRGWWENEHFRLATKLKREELVDFFIHQYKPTPLFNPWGARSGFYPDDSEKSARTVLSSIEKNKDQRLETYRKTIAVVRDIIDKKAGGHKPKGDNTGLLILALRNHIRGKSSLWMDSVAAFIGHEKNCVTFPALFGTGGSEGSGSYTSAFMEAVDQCIIKHKWDHTMEAVLFGSYTVPNCDWIQSMGQFMPGGDATPWDLLMAFEGACVVRSSISSRTDNKGTRWMSSPFFVAPASYGYSSNALQDEYISNKGKRMSGRGEQWFPLWRQPMLFAELSQIFGEGRAATKRTRATDSWSMVRAVTSLGVRRGISEFIRYGYQQRNNLASHFAIPLGRFRVNEQVDPQSSCLDDLDGWLPRLRHEARTKQSTNRLQFAERRLTEALFMVAKHPDEPVRWQSVLLNMAGVEKVQRAGSGFKAGPVPPLSPQWVKAGDDGSPEYRLAVACAMQSRAFRKDCGKPIDPIRRHWLPLKGNGFARSGSEGQKSLQVGTDVVVHGYSGIDDAIALVERRLIEAAQRGKRRLPLVAAQLTDAAPSDLTMLVAGLLDINRIMALARALMAIDGRSWAEKPCPVCPAKANLKPDDAWIAIRLSMLPWPIPDRCQIGFDPAIVRRLSSGDGTSAVELAMRRLRAAGISSTVRSAVVSPEIARYWAAALAFPISKNTAKVFLRCLDPNSMQGE